MVSAALRWNDGRQEISDVSERHEPRGTLVQVSAVIFDLRRFSFDS